MSDKLAEINPRNMAKILRLREWNRLNAANEESVRDALTGLHNRRYFDREIEKINNQPGTLVVVDIDKFKNTNDSYGHLAGDKVLISLARILQAKIQIIGNGEGPDIVARLGGEEFGIYLKNFTDKALVKDRVEEVRKAVEASFVEHEGKQVKTTISLGVAIREPGERFENLMRRADQALYDAKESGRNKYVVSNENV